VERRSGCGPAATPLASHIPGRPAIHGSLDVVLSVHVYPSSSDSARLIAFAVSESDTKAKCGGVSRRRRAAPAVYGDVGPRRGPRKVHAVSLKGSIVVESIVVLWG
jgi:hypothetical protein